jgi:uncharacterized peroxidase-related enzyme
MPYIDLPAGYPGIRSLFMYSPQTALPLNHLVQTLLWNPDTSTLTPGERELIATYTSSLNHCKYCCTTHGVIAKYQLGGDDTLVRTVVSDPTFGDLSDKMKALLTIAAKVQDSGKSVSGADVQKAKDAGATEKEVHDAVLIAAAFCMFNRYVDGLGTWAPDNEEVYEAIGKQRAAEGYMTKPFVVQ